MAKKVFTDESLATLVEEIKSYTDEAVSSKSDSTHTHDGRYYTKTVIDNKLDGKADVSHGNHVPATETANNAKFLRNDNTWATVTPANIGAAESSHGTHVSYSSTVPVMDGTASVGSASTVARSDHKHPTDTTRVSKETFDAHTASHAPSNAEKNIIVGIQKNGTDLTVNSSTRKVNITVPTQASDIGAAPSSHTHTVSQITDLTATVTELNYMDGVTSSVQTQLDGKVPTSRTINSKALSSNITLSASDVGASPSNHTHSAYVNQNAFSNVKVGEITVAADTTTDALTLIPGSNVTIDADTTNDSITITAKDTTYSAGTGISLSGTTFSNSGVRSISTGTSNGTISVNTNGTSANVTVKGLGSAAYTDSKAYDAAGTAKSKADAALASANTYTDTAISNLINSAPETLDTLGEIATAMAENANVVDALEQAIGGKADKTHTHTVSHTPVGTVGSKSITPTGSVASTFTGTAASHSHTFTGTEATHGHTFTGEEATISATYTPVGTISKPSFTGSAVNSGTPSGTTPSTTVASSSHTHKYTPSGTVSKPTFTGTQATISATYTPVGSVSKPTFTGSSVTSGAPNTTNASTTVASSSHTHKYTPIGTVSQPSFTGSEVTSGEASGTATVYSITAVGSLPSHTYTAPTHTYTAPSLTSSVTNRCLTLTFSAGAHTFNAGSHDFSAGSLPTKGTGVSVATGAHTHKVTASGSVSQPTFTGTEASTTSITGTTSVASTSHTHNVTAAGSVTQPTFTGTEETISTTYTPAGSVSQPTFTGTEASTTSITGTTSVASTSHVHSVTAEGGVSKPTFTGTQATIGATYTPTGTIAETAMTPAGTISSKSLTPAGSVASTFTGTAASHSHSFTGTEATLTTSNAK